MGTETNKGAPVAVQQRHHHQQQHQHQQQRQHSVETTDLDVYIDEHSVLDGARQVLELIRPDWSVDHITYKVRSGKEW